MSPYRLERPEASYPGGGAALGGGGEGGVSTGPRQAGASETCRNWTFFFFYSCRNALAPFFHSKSQVPSCVF